MKEYPNFYETLKEALARLRGTIVLYDGEPYYVMTITNHKPDGIYRIYLEPLPEEPKDHNYPQVLSDYPPEHEAIGAKMDSWMLSNKTSGVLRKSMNSALFNKFRPYPLGMCNLGLGAYYIARQPNRKMEQGLLRSMLDVTQVNVAGPTGGPFLNDTFSHQFRSCIMGEYPSPHTCLANLLDPAVQNESVGFARDFALVRGPVGMVFLGYKTDIVGVLPNSDFSLLRLSKEHRHVREAVECLHLFSQIV